MTLRVCPLDERMARIEKRDRRVARLAEVLFDTGMLAAERKAEIVEAMQ